MKTLNKTLSFESQKAEVLPAAERRKKECAALNARVAAIRTDRSFRVGRQIGGVIFHLLMTALFGFLPLCWYLSVREGTYGLAMIGVRFRTTELLELPALPGVDVDRLVPSLIAAALFSIALYAAMCFIRAIVRIVKGSRLNAISTGIRMIEGNVDRLRTAVADRNDKFVKKPAVITTLYGPDRSIEFRINKVTAKLNSFSAQSRLSKVFTALAVIFAACFCLSISAAWFLVFLNVAVLVPGPIVLVWVCIGLTFAFTLFTYIWRFIRILTRAADPFTGKVFARLCVSALIMVIINFLHVFIATLIAGNITRVWAYILGIVVFFASIGLWRLFNRRVRNSR